MEIITNKQLKSLGLKFFSKKGNFSYWTHKDFKDWMFIKEIEFNGNVKSLPELNLAKNNYYITGIAELVRSLSGDIDLVGMGIKFPQSGCGISTIDQLLTTIFCSEKVIKCGGDEINCQTPSIEELEKELVLFMQEKYGDNKWDRTKKLEEEHSELMCELKRLHKMDFYLKERVGYEIADNVAVLTHLAHIFGYNLTDILSMVLDKLKQREINPNYKRD